MVQIVNCFTVTASSWENSMDKAKKKNEPVKKHNGHNWIMVRGHWGPHTAKYICADCEGAWVKWVSIKKAL